MNTRVAANDMFARPSSESLTCGEQGQLQQLTFLAVQQSEETRIDQEWTVDCPQNIFRFQVTVEFRFILQSVE